MDYDNNQWDIHRARKQKMKQFLLKVPSFTIMNFPPPVHSYNYLSCEKMKKKIFLSESHKDTSKLPITNSNFNKLPNNNEKKNYLPFLDDTISVFNNPKIILDKNTVNNFKSPNRNDKNKINGKILPDICFSKNILPIADKLLEYLNSKSEGVHNSRNKPKINLENINHQTMKKIKFRNKENYFKYKYPTLNENFKNFCNQRVS